MAQYEIRVLKQSGAESLVYACQFFTDRAAVRGAEQIARASGESLEVWRGMECIYCSRGLAQTG